MAKLSEILLNDVRFREGLTACMNCGVCTAICPAAEFYKYDPRQICSLVQSKDEEKIEELLRSETIWYCGQCMSCKTRCPRGNVPGLVITVLRKLSQELGYFTESEKGRQQFALKRVVGHSILRIGYCVHPDIVVPEKHPEQGPIWKWYIDNIQEVTDRLGANYHRRGPGALRIIAEDNLEEIKKIFEVTGGTDLQNDIETFSLRKAREMGYTEKNIDKYTDMVYTENSDDHQK
ncbi:hypothetical protein D0T49_07625 [Paludibacter sp. 221]|uniref:4Fe-4S dicluster domain-containing protein n=1 Tax=Paludibacter sp. 221 TaxID=2302939 RepID=UPI0013D4D31E|nr:4Fe-4S dicluster domain-containing protein [Paludibacter sp. 221]NDV46915.1 hypothetical protein [Paludibacter sp. 221]